MSGKDLAQIKIYKTAIIALLKQRSSGKTICPSELLSGADKKNKKMMENVRQAASLLAKQGLIEITQKSKVVDPDAISGPIRLRLKKG